MALFTSKSFALLIIWIVVYFDGLGTVSGLSGLADAEVISEESEEVIGYSKQNELLEERVRILEGKIDMLQVTLEKDQLRDDTIEKKLQELTARQKDQNPTQLNDNAANIRYNESSSIETSIYRRQSPDTSIAFSAYLDRDQDLGQDQVIRFNHVLTNEGNCFNTRTGVFTPSISGVYFLTFFIGQHGINEVLVKLVVNDIPMVHATAETVAASDDSQGGNVVLLKLTKGDDVKIEHAIRGSHVEGSRGIRLSTFSGFLLYSTEYEPSIIGK